MTAARPPKVVVTGASGNVGSGVLRALAAQMPDADVVGVCRRPPRPEGIYARVHWHAVDLGAPSAVADLAPAMSGADIVIHLALAVQPVDDEDYLYRVNVTGSQAVLTAMTDAGVKHLVYASSLGIYAPGGSDPVPETWSDAGQATSVYSRHKVAVERILDRFEVEHPDVVVGRFRPTVVVQREAAWLIRSLYVGQLIPAAVFALVRNGKLPVLPLPDDIALQFVHADDVGAAVVKMIEHRARGSYNIAADVLDADALAGLVGARPVEVKPALVRGAVVVLNRLGLVALTPGWYDVAFKTPVMDTTKARRELGWEPAWSSTEAALELIGGLADGAVGTTAAMGFEGDRQVRSRNRTDLVHDASLALWTATALARALGFHRARALDVVVIGTNLVAGTPMALERVRQRRRDAAAVLAPVTVAAAVLASLRGGWPPVAATAALQGIAASERRRSGPGPVA